ncbi:MAG TPA: choice-of-anchor Q domain-containing protein, partial [Anaerolineaceae bacterium]|nr:choice-of-anchor Q domain-containing protein [Anaerolineaceae bacterium]HPN52942.1 choice-of-anchor Q domain-containing protein [Anaerolineaceae bacterium]
MSHKSHTSVTRFARTAVLTGVLLLGLVAGLLPQSMAQAAAFDLYVDDDSSNVSTNCQDSGNPCKTITYALTQASNPSDTYIIHIADGIYNQGLGESFPITISSANISLVGAGSGTTLIYGNNIARVFTLSASGAISMSKMTIWRGNAADGGGIYAADGTSLTLDDIVFLDNNASGQGGALYKTGSGNVTISNTTFNQNTAANGAAIFVTGSNVLTIDLSTFSKTSGDANIAAANGGGIYRDGGSAQISGTTFQYNQAGASGLGGAIFATNNATVNIFASSVFTQNTAGQGAGIYNLNSTLTVTNSNFIANTAATNGGAVFNQNPGKTAALNGILVRGNSAANGAGLYQADGSLEVTNISIISSNTASVNGGGVYQNGGSLNLDSVTLKNNAAVNGAGLYQAKGDLTLLRSTASSNTATTSGGAFAITGTSTAVFATSTISGNNAQGTSLSEGGGGIFTADAAALDLSFMTIAANTAVQSNRSAVYINSGAVTVTASLFSDNKCTGSFQSGGDDNIAYNASAACLPGGGVNNLSTTTALVLPLADNGGLTFTHALTTTSPAINFVAAGCGGTDQREKTRPDVSSGICDAGAVEFQLPAILLDAGNLTYSELSPALAVSSNAVLVDDRTTFTASDTLVVSFNGSEHASDTLKVKEAGLFAIANIAGELYVNYGGYPIATVTGGYYNSQGATDLVFTLNGTYATHDNIQNLLRAVAYQNLNFNPDSSDRFVRFQITHDGDASPWVTRTISIDDPNIAPTAYDGSATLNEDTTATIDFATTTLYVDPDPYPVGDAYPWKIIITRLPATTEGTLYDADMNPVSLGTEILRTTGTPLIFSPTLNYYGTTSFSWKAMDFGASGPGTAVATSNEALYTLYVIEVSDPPNPGGPYYATTTEYVSVTGTILATDPDPMETLSYAVGDAPASGTATITVDSGIWTYQPINRNATYTVSFTVAVTDSSANTATATVYVEVGALSEAPMVSGPFFATTTEDVSATDTMVAVDPEGGAITYTITAQPETGFGTATVAADSGIWEYYPENRTSSYTATTYAQANDVDGLNASTTITISVLADNDPPEAGGPYLGATTEDAATTDTITGSDPDVDDVLTYSIFAQPAPGYGTVSIQAASGIWTYTPVNRNDSYIATFYVMVQDIATQTDTAAVLITVTGDNETPTLDNAIPDQVATEDLAFSFAFAANTFSDADAGDILTYSAFTPAWLNFDGASRTFSGTPANDDVGVHTVTVTAADLSA